MTRKRTVTWDAPVNNEDGTQISDALSYKVYNGAEVMGTTSDTYLEVELGGGTYQMTVTAINSAGNESNPSEVLTVEGRFPMPPTNLRVV
jgi:predicted phage tail protein